MIFIYNIGLIILSIILLPLILAAFIIQPKFRAGFWQKIGFYKKQTDEISEQTVVFHAVSVGEVNAIKELVKRYHEKNPKHNIIITTTTKTGHEIAVKSLSQFANKIVYFPYDYFFSVLSFLNTFSPAKIIIAETEIWPSFTTIAKSKGIKVYIVNGRISPHSFDGYKKIKLFMAPLLNNYEKIFMQSLNDAQRIRQLGAKDNKTEVMGNLKFDISANLESQEYQKYVNELKTNGFKILIGASTHKGEDEIVLKAFNALKQKHQESKLLLAPRHPQRYEEVSVLLNNTKYKWGKRSNNDNFVENEIIMLDTMGELSKLFSICHAAFIGGSFSSTGGHNPLEANIWAKPVISGSCVFNFKDVYKIVTEKKCAVIVNNEDEFIKELISLYEDQEKYNTMCNNAKSVFDENQGAVDFVLERI